MEKGELIFDAAIEVTTYHVEDDPPSSLRCCSRVRFFMEIFSNRFSETLSMTERVLWVGLINIK